MENEQDTIIELTADIVAAYVSNNSVPMSALQELISDIFTSLAKLADRNAPTPIEKTAPAVSPKRSVHPDHLICLEDGKRFKSLKRHLSTSHGLTPKQYREKWSLPADYPMVAPRYAAQRSELAKGLGLGRKKAAEVATPKQVKRGRPRK